MVGGAVVISIKWIFGSRGETPGLIVPRGVSVPELGRFPKASAHALTIKSSLGLTMLKTSTMPLITSMLCLL